MKQEDLERMRRMEDFTLSESAGPTVNMRFDVIRAMPQSERDARRRAFDRFCLDLRIKYADTIRAQG